ncbi:carotenoid biosynthesis protein [Aquimarina algicola]|uniref:Carotenoid biosynthesis protein n=1 Tax=Aquimarina algicola TaxID=2589995 RepID=A0A504IZK4_9FLAO|nr:carotenoid biosynthesis protein [Aquimarina algicola]TPN83967.1 carotenoid biosynthesis protein [Aquimarina algicola]
MTEKIKNNISIGVIWLFNISGIIGILLGYEDWFLRLTPLNLLIYLFLILWNQNFNPKLILMLSIPFCVGMIAEGLGVNFGLIFGNYEYGENLGYKVFGVPLMIGVNWAILTYSSAAIARKIHSGLWVSSLLASILMVAMDVILEVSAPRFDFWEFENNIVPLQNYVGWFGTAFVAHMVFQKLSKTYNYNLSIHIFVAILVFFTVFLFF